MEGMERIGGEYEKRMNSTAPEKRGVGYKRRMRRAKVY